ncbi:helix-turn-helix transcriptional regulator [Legionella sp.]|uniref:helix-turn-helix transcriptional regulator n=1 Tax=Legionella sp. TaxID=459 RepID=UPI003C973904
MQNALSHVWVRQVIYLDFRLTKKENQCLYLSAQGKTIKEIALFFQVTVKRVEQYRQAIFEKLACTNMIEAVFIGICYGKRSPLNEQI